MTEQIRPAAESDLDAMAALILAREQADARSGPGLFAGLQPASGADRVADLRRMMAGNMERGGQVALVAEDGGRVVGFAVIGGIGVFLPQREDELMMATLAEFDLEPDRWPTAAPALFDGVLGAAGRHEVGFLVAQSLAPEAEKRRLFESVGMRVSMESWWMSLAQREASAEGPAVAGGVRVRPASVMDVDALVARAVAHRAESADRDLDFFGEMTEGAAEARRKVLTEWIASPDADLLIAEAAGQPVGYTMVVDVGGMGGDLPEHVALIQELIIDPEQWPSAGRALLYAALDAARHRGAEQVLVNYDTVDPVRRDDLQAVGLAIVSESWYMKLERPGG